VKLLITHHESPGGGGGWRRYDWPMTDERDAAATDQPLPLEHAGEGETLSDPVEDASADSFPASDPPSFTGSTATSDSTDEDAGSR
jgi:hypothetical protein